MNELGSSRNHFIRCIKPNEKKLPKLPEPTYILTQVRYLGVFETIQIRKKTFPVRKTLEDFCRAYRVMFPNVKGKENVSVIQQIMAQLKVPEKQYLMGNRRVYLSKEI